MLVGASARAQMDRAIWAMAWPAIPSFVVVNCVDIVDVGLVERLGRHPLAAVGYSTQCVNVVETLLISVGIGTVALVARALGARDPRRGRQALAGSLLVALCVSGLGLALAIATAPAPHPGAAQRASPPSSPSASPYFRLDRGGDGLLRRGVRLRARPAREPEHPRADASSPSSS